MRDVLRRIREDLGPDALVLATEMVAARGWPAWVGLREVQVTAASAMARAGRPTVAERRPADTSGGPRSEDAVCGGLVARLLASGPDRAHAERGADAAMPAECRDASRPVLCRLLADQLGEIAAGEEPHARVEIVIGPPGVGKTASRATPASLASVLLRDREWGAADC